MIPLLKEIAEQSKRQILVELRSGPKSVTEIVEVTGMKQPNVSNHLAKLRLKGIVKASKIGRQVFYSLASPEVEATLVGFLEREDDDGVGSSLNFDDLAKQYARAAVAGNEAACSRIVDQLLRHNVPLVRIYQQVLAESMHYVGKWYEVAAIDVGQEHLASAITERMMARVVHYAPPTRINSKTALIGCVAGNWHAIGARMISDFMRLSGWRAVFLGANTPQDSFLSAIKEHEPQVVLASIAFDEDRPTAMALIRALKDVKEEGRGEFLIGVGGRQASIDPEHFIRSGADFTAANLMVFAEEVLPRIEDGATSTLGVFTNHKKVD